MKQCRIIILICLLLSFQFFGQVKNPEYLMAEEFLAQGNYPAALNLYLQQLKLFPNSAIINYKIGFCYLHSRSQVSRAISYFEKAIQNSSPVSTSLQAHHEADAPGDVCKLLGDACFSAYKFDQAIPAYEKYRDLLLAETERNESQLEQLKNKIETSRFALELKELSSQKPYELLEEIPGGLTSKNISSGNYTSTLSPDKSSMIFSFKLPVIVYRNKPEDQRYFEEEAVHSSQKPAMQKTSEDSVSFAATIGTAIDGQAILTYRNENGRASLYISYLRNDKWTKPQKLSESPNPDGWEPDEFLSVDGKTLYFVSQRAGGFGGKDIYYCIKNRNGSWSKAKNAGRNINTAYDDCAPFLHPDGSLFFSSNRNFSNQFEIFSSQMSEKGDWQEAINIGFPLEKKNITATGHAQVKQIPEEAKARLKKIEKKADTLNDKRHFLVNYISPDKKSMVVLSGKIKSAETLSETVTVKIIDLSEESLQAIYYPENKNGEFAIVIPPNKNIGIFYEAKEHLFSSEHIIVQADKQYFSAHESISLKKIAPEAFTALNNTFFNESGSDILPSSHEELNRIYELVKQHPGMKIKLISYQYASKNKSSARKLSKARSKALKNYLVQRGLNEKQIQCKAHLHKKIRSKEEKNGALHDTRNYLLILKIISVN